MLVSQSMALLNYIHKYVANLHLKILDAGNNHHMAEALFKAFGKALDVATMEEPRIKDVWSTKGSL